MKVVVVVLYALLSTLSTDGHRQDLENHHSRDTGEHKDCSKSDENSSSESRETHLVLHVPQTTLTIPAVEFTYQLNAKLGYHYPRNKKHEKVALLDYHHNTSVFYDGISGDTFAFSYEEGIGVYIPGGVSDKTWNVKEQSFEEYFKNPCPPKDLFSIGEKHGYQFDPQLISDDMSEKLSGILTPLSIDYSSQCESLATALHVSKITSDRFKTSLSGFEKVTGDVFAYNRGDFKWLIGMHQGMGEFFAPFGSIDVLSEKHIHLDWGRILTEKGSIYVLRYLLELLASHFDLGKILGKQMNSELEFFTLLNKLGGEIDYGSDGLIYILTEISKFNYGENSKENLLVLLKKYVTNPRGSSKGLEQSWQSWLKILVETIRKLKLEDAFKDLSKRLQDIEEGKWEQNGVNMSALFSEIIKIEIPGKPDEALRILQLLEKKL